MSREAVPHLKKQGGGRIINILASTVYQPIPNLALSGATRMGVVAFAKSLADEVGRDGILVNNVCPGSILSERMLSNVTARAKELGISVDEALAQRAAETAVGRIGEPKELAYLVAFLASGKGQLHHRHHDPGRWRAGPLGVVVGLQHPREEDAMQYNRISADCHIDMPWIPDDLFTANATAAMRDRMPYVVDGPDGPHWTCKNGTSFGLVGGVGPGGQKLVPGQNYRVDKMAAVGLYDDGKKGIRRPTDPHLRIKDMELDGVQAEVIFGILGAATRLNDHDAAKEMFRIYNDWLKDFCRHYPDRQIGLACLPYGDIDAAVQEVRRVAKMGLKGIELSCSWDMDPMWHPVWEPLWQAVSEVNLPLHFHTFPSTPASVREKATTNLARRAALFQGVCGFQMNLVNILSAIVGSAVLERYPNLKISFGESGIGWIPYALDRMDFEWEDRFRDLGLTHEAERLLAAPVQGDVPVRPHRDPDDPRDGCRDAHVGIRLSAHRRRVARVVEVHRGAVRAPAGRRGSQDHVRERGQVLRADVRLSPRGASTGPPCPPSSFL